MTTQSVVTILPMDSRRVRFGAPRLQYPASPNKMKLFAAILDDDGIRYLQVYDSVREHEPSRDALHCVAVAETPIKCTMKFRAVRDQESHECDLSVPVAVTVTDPASLLKEDIADLATEQAPVDSVALADFIAPRLLAKVREAGKAKTGTELTDLEWWNQNLNKWLEPLGMSATLSENPSCTSPSLEAAKHAELVAKHSADLSEQRRREEAEILAAREQRRREEAEILAERERQADFDKKRKAIEADTQLSDRERDRQLEASAHESEKQHLRSAQLLEAIRDEGELRRREHAMNISRLDAKNRAELDEYDARSEEAKARKARASPHRRLLIRILCVMSLLLMGSMWYLLQHRSMDPSPQPRSIEQPHPWGASAQTLGPPSYSPPPQSGAEPAVNLPVGSSHVAAEPANPRASLDTATIDRLAQARAAAENHDLPHDRSAIILLDQVQRDYTELPAAVDLRKQVLLDQNSIEQKIGALIRNVDALVHSTGDLNNLKQAENVVQQIRALDKDNLQLPSLDSAIASCKRAIHQRADMLAVEAAKIGDSLKDKAAMDAVVRLQQVDPDDSRAADLRDAILADEASIRQRVTMLQGTAQQTGTFSIDENAIRAADTIRQLDPENTLAISLRAAAVDDSAAITERIRTLMKSARSRNDKVHGTSALAQLDEVLRLAPADEDFGHQDALALQREIRALYIYTNDAGQSFPLIVNSMGMEFVRLEPDTFAMGDPTGIVTAEMRHSVTLSRPFSIARCDVTVEQFAKFVASHGPTSAERTGSAHVLVAGRWELAPRCSWREPGFIQRDDHPVVCVSWEDATAYCQWLSQQDNGRFHYHLPTEAQWEYACRGGRKTEFPWGDQAAQGKGWCNVADQRALKVLPSLTNTFPFDDGFIYTSPVMAFRPNAFGLYDMTGNVWQWCADWYSPLDAEKTIDPTGPADGAGRRPERVVRGGSWDSGSKFCRCSCRMMKPPQEAWSIIGFRCVMDVAR